jgi:hypothetical protein
MDTIQILITIIVLIGIFYLYKIRESFYDPSSGVFYDYLDNFYDPYYSSLYYYPYDYPFWWYYGSGSWGGSSRWNYPYRYRNYRYNYTRPYHALPITNRPGFPNAGRSSSLSKSPKGLTGGRIGGYAASGGRIGGVSGFGAGRGGSFGGGGRGGGGGRR